MSDPRDTARPYIKAWGVALAAMLLALLSFATAAEEPTRNSAPVAISWSADAEEIRLVTRDGFVRVFKVNPVELRETRKLPAQQVLAVQWSPDAARAAVLEAERTFSILDGPLRRRLGRVTLAEAHSDIRQMAWSPSGSSLAVGFLDGRIRLFDAEGLTETRTLEFFPSRGAGNFRSVVAKRGSATGGQPPRRDFDLALSGIHANGAIRLSTLERNSCGLGVLEPGWPEYRSF